MKIEKDVMDVLNKVFENLNFSNTDVVDRISNEENDYEGSVAIRKVIDHEIYFKCTYSESSYTGNDELTSIKLVTPEPVEKVIYN